MNGDGFAYCLDQGNVAWDEEPAEIQGEDFLREATSTRQSPLAREQ